MKNIAKDLFDKIYVDNKEIDLQELDNNKGKFHLGQQKENVNVKFVLKEETTEIPEKLFAGTDMTDITLPEVITNVASDAFEGLTLPAETIAALEEKLPEGEELNDVTEKTEEQQEEPQPQTYTVTFKDGEAVIGEPITGVTGTAVEVPANPEKEGYTFAGWSTDGETVIIPIANIGEADVTYIAVWNEVQQEPQPEADENYIEFVSYGDNAGQTEWGQGVVFKTNITETIEVNQVETELTKVIVKINLSPSKEKLSEWIGKEFYIVSNAVKDDDNLYELYAKENDIITSAEIWVKIYSLFKDEAVMGTNYDYVHDETSWNASYNSGALEHYYEWADKLSMYKEDLWNEADSRPAAWADWVKDENNQPILDDNGNIQYIDRLGNPCVRCWNGAVYAPDARYPWIVPYFAQDENAPEERNYIVFSYEGKADVMPWNGIWGNKNKYIGSASLAEEFKDKGFLLYENSDLSKFTAEWQQIIPTWDGTLVQENEEPKFNINDFKMYLLHR